MKKLNPLKTEQDMSNLEAQVLDLSSSSKEKQQAAHMVLDYTSKALPVHIEQINDVISSTEKVTLSLTEHFSQLLYTIEQNINSSREVKKKLQQKFIDILGKNSDQMNSINGIFSELVTDTQNIEKNSSEILLSLQFQDSTRQILEHVQEDLEKITQDIHSLDILLSIENTEQSHQIEENLSKRYTMESERQAYLRSRNNKTNEDKSSTNKNEGKNNSSDEDEITFF